MIYVHAGFTVLFLTLWDIGEMELATVAALGSLVSGVCLAFQR